MLRRIAFIRFICFLQTEEQEEEEISSSGLSLLFVTDVTRQGGGLIC
jgi:hypothetical protein